MSGRILALRVLTSRVTAVIRASRRVAAGHLRSSHVTAGASCRAALVASGRVMAWQTAPSCRVKARLSRLAWAGGSSLVVSVGSCQAEPRHGVLWQTSRVVPPESGHCYPWRAEFSRGRRVESRPAAPGLVASGHVAPWPACHLSRRVGSRRGDSLASCLVLAEESRLGRHVRRVKPCQLGSSRYSPVLLGEPGRGRRVRACLPSHGPSCLPRPSPGPFVWRWKR